MFKIIAVTHRQLCPEPLEHRIRVLAHQGTDAIIVREKDFSETDYRALAQRTLTACEGTRAACILHSYPSVARGLDCSALHMPLHLLKEMTDEERAAFSTLGASCHSLSDVREAENLGCTYVTVGHIFSTDCKRSLEPRGLPFLHDICHESIVPVYAIGGIHADNITQVRQAGAAGACIMSGLMTCTDVAATLNLIRTNA